MARAPASFPEERLAILRSYAWPGNVRELRNQVERGCLLATGGSVFARHLELPGSQANAPGTSKVAAPGAEAGAEAAPSNGPPLSPQAEELRAALDRNRWNQVATAKDLGISRATLFRRRKKYGL